MDVKVILINIDTEDRFGLSGTNWVPPLGLVALSSYLKNSGYEIKIFDSMIEKLDTLEQKVLNISDEYTIAGFYTSFLNYQNVLTFAEKLKQKGVKIVIGGPYASSMKFQILKNRDFIDLVIFGEGEEALLSYLEGKPLKEIPNIAYKQNGEIIINKYKKFDINNSCLDYTLISLEKYQERFRKKNNTFKAPVSYYAHKGCSWKRCIFCAIPYKSPQRKDPKFVWDELKELHELFRIDYIYETGESFTDNIAWLIELVNSKSINLSWEIFGRADMIQKETARLLKELGVYKVFIGVETANLNLLKYLKKSSTPKDVKEAISLLKSFEINVVPSFMCGVLKETEDTLKETLYLAKEIKDICQSNEVLVFPMTPIPGSPAFKMLKEKCKKYSNRDLFDIEELQNDWYKNFCYVDSEAVYHYVKEIKNVFQD